MYGRTAIHSTVEKFLILLDSDQHICNIPMTAIAKQLGVSLFHLHHLVKRDVGKSCAALIRASCVERAKTLLLLYPDKTISEIAYSCGHEPQSLYRHFIAELGRSPSELRRSIEQSRSHAQHLTDYSQDQPLPDSKRSATMRRR
jgi:AraC-like DNA-binding protein